MGTFTSFRKAYGALKDSTKVGLAKVNSEYKVISFSILYIYICMQYYLRFQQGYATVIWIVTS